MPCPGLEQIGQDSRLGLFVQRTAVEEQLTICPASLLQHAHMFITRRSKQAMLQITLAAACQICVSQYAPDSIYIANFH